MIGGAIGVPLFYFYKPMPTARHGLGEAAVGQSIYVLSGGPKPGGTFSSANEVFTP